MRNTKAPTLRIGMEWPSQGGILAGMMPGQNGAPDYFLVLATEPAGYNERIQWGGYEKDSPGATSEFDGQENTRALVQEGGHPAADWASGLVINGHADWYLPARRELRALWCTVGHLFVPGWYWTSTQYSPHDAWTQFFADGSQHDGHKDLSHRARVVRRFLIQ